MSHPTNSDDEQRRLARGEPPRGNLEPFCIFCGLYDLPLSPLGDGTFACDAAECIEFRMSDEQLLSEVAEAVAHLGYHT